MEVRLFSPRTGVAHVGRLIGTDAARQSFVAQVDDADVLTHPSSLMEATLCVGGGASADGSSAADRPPACAFDPTFARRAC